MSRLVIVLQGVSGSGKSTYARKLANEARQSGYASRIVSADAYFEKGGTYKFDFTKLGEAHGECFRAFLENVAIGIEVVIVDNTCTRVIEIAPYMLGAQAFGYAAEVHRLVCDPKVASARNLHDVSLGSVISMDARIASERLPPWWKLTEVAV